MSTATNSPVDGLSSPSLERHYAPEELAEIWGVSANTVRRLFECEPGVFVIEHLKGKKKRRYRTLRIPASVAERVYRRMTRV